MPVAALASLLTPEHEPAPSDLNKKSTIPPFLTQRAPFFSLREPTLDRDICLLYFHPDNLTLGFPTSECSVWAALLSRDVQGHVWMRGRQCTALDSILT